MPVSARRKMFFTNWKHGWTASAICRTSTFFWTIVGKTGGDTKKGADFFCKTDYGGSEGIYLDVYLEWQEGDKPKKECFITGKTLGESGADMDRMFLISSAITKAIRGDNSVHARYIVAGRQPEPEETMSLNLSPDEQRLVAQALAEQCIRLGSQAEGEEKLLRRMTGNVMEYMDAAGLPIGWTRMTGLLAPARWRAGNCAGHGRDAAMSMSAIAARVAATLLTSEKDARVSAFCWSLFLRRSSWSRRSSARHVRWGRPQQFLAVEASFYGVTYSEDVPDEFRTHIADMQTAFSSSGFGGSGSQRDYDRRQSP